MQTDADNIIGLYRRHARTWANLRGSQLRERKWLGKFMALLPPNPSILDLGCGSGDPIARHFVQKGSALTGVDASPELIDIARAHLPMAHWVVSDMRALNLETKFNGLLAWHSMFHLTPQDQRKLFRVFERHAAAGAALMFTAGPAAGVSMGVFEGEPLYHASLDPQDYRALLDQHGFRLVDYVIEDPACDGCTVWLAQYHPADPA